MITGSSAIADKPARLAASPQTCLQIKIILIDSFTGSTYWCCPSRPCMVFLACMHLTLFIALSLSPGNSLVTSPTEGDGGLCFRRRRYVGRYICLWTTSWHRFKSYCHQSWSVIRLATGDKVIKFWKVKVKRQGRWGRYALHWALLVCSWCDHNMLASLLWQCLSATSVLQLC